MVKAAVMAGNRGGLRRKEVEEVDVDGDYGLPLSSPALIIPIVGLILLALLGVVVLLCKWFACCGKKSREKDLELQLGRHTRTSSSSRRKSESFKSSSSGGGGSGEGGGGIRRPSSSKLREYPPDRYRKEREKPVEKKSSRNSPHSISNSLQINTSNSRKSKNTGLNLCPSSHSPSNYFNPISSSPSNSNKLIAKVEKEEMIMSADHLLNVNPQKSDKNISTEDDNAIIRSESS